MARRKLSSIGDDFKKAVIRGVREAAVEIMNGLVEAGPAYTGEFSSAWYVVPKGGSPGGPRRPNGGSIYKYDLRNVPEARLKDGILFQIVNGHPMAAVIQDLEEGLFVTQYDKNGDIAIPLKTPVDVGRRNRNPGMRGDVSSGEGFAISTAPQDWYTTYSSGGRLDFDLRRGVDRGLKRGIGGIGFGS